MKTEDIIDSLGRIDDDLISEAASVRNGVKRRRMFNWQPIITAAACVALIGGAVFALRDKIWSDTVNPPPPPVTETNGRIIEFGGYNWIVLEESDGKALILSETVLEDMAYYSVSDFVTWEVSDIRAYLINTFYECFSEEDKSRIIQTHVINNDNPEYGSVGGDDTDDRIFLLSVEEAEKYFADDAARTAYYANGEAASWWLRTPGYSNETVDYGSIYAVKVTVNGEIKMNGTDVDQVAFGGVRPAMWIYLTPEDAENALENALKPFGLLGDYKVGENGEILIKYPDGNPTYEPDTFRKYFFGTWEYSGREMIVDDSEMCNNNIMLRAYVYWVSDHVIEVAFINGGLGQLYWMDINSPDVMYTVKDVSGYDEEYDLAGNIKWQPYCQVYRKKAAPVNEPQNGYTSRLKLAEIEHDYEMNSYLFTDITQEEKNGITLHRDDTYFDRAIYMITQEADEFVFRTSVHGEVKTTLANGSTYMLFENEVDVVVTLRKIDGEWERTLQFDEEARNQLFEEAEKRTAPLQETMSFGGYDWLVLDKQGDKALLLSEYVLEVLPYHTSFTDITWEKCSLREYLNGEFYNKFGDEDKARILDTLVVNDDNPAYGTDGGNDTNDKVFLLSFDEMQKYFIDDYSRMAFNPDGTYADWWWLRTPGFNSDCAAAVQEGSLFLHGATVYDVNNGVGVRPAMWITLE